MMFTFQTLLVFLLSLLGQVPYCLAQVTMPSVTVIPVSHHQTTLLVFPFPIEAADMGSTDIAIKPFVKGSNILKVKATKVGFLPTNLSVLTENRQLFTVGIAYDSLPRQAVYFFKDTAQSDALSPTVANPIVLEKLAWESSYQWPWPRIRQQRQYRMHYTLRNILYKHDLLFFVLSVDNKSTIPYDIHFIRAYQRDRQHAKRSSQTEKELLPIGQYFSSGKRIDGNQKTTIVLVFNKFTITDHKKMAIELFETNGDRVLTLDIKGRHLLQARSW